MKDATALFNKYHSWVNPAFMLKNCYLGMLDGSDGDDDDDDDCDDSEDDYDDDVKDGNSFSDDENSQK